MPLPENIIILFYWTAPHVGSVLLWINILLFHQPSAFDAVLELYRIINSVVKEVADALVFVEAERFERFACFDAKSYQLARGFIGVSERQTL